MIDRYLRDVKAKLLVISEYAGYIAGHADELNDEIDGLFVILDSKRDADAENDP